MSLTVGQANDVNELLDYILGIERPALGPCTSEHARQAAERLADAAHRRIMAGIRGTDVTAAWPHLELPGRSTT